VIYYSRRTTDVLGPFYTGSISRAEEIPELIKSSKQPTIQKATEQQAT